VRVVRPAVTAWGENRLDIVGVGKGPGSISEVGTFFLFHTVSARP